MNLTDPLELVKGIGEKTAATLRAADLITVNDLLVYLPVGYDDSTNILTLEELREKITTLPVWESPKEKYALKGVIEKVSTFRSRRGMIIVTVTIASGESKAKCKAIWFNQEFIFKQLEEGATYIFFGKVKVDGNSLNFQSPKIERVLEDFPLVKLGKVQPIYRRVKSVTSTYISKYTNSLVTQLSLLEYIPEDLQQKYGIEALAESFKKVHIPTTIADTIYGRRSLSIRELVELRDEYLHKFKDRKVVQDGEEIGKKLTKYIGSWQEKLPFKLTVGQEKSILTLLEEIVAKKSLDMLLYGDVGSGKTIIALLVALGFCKLGYSSIVIAPTTILASQHIHTAITLLKTLGLESEVVVSEVTAKKKLDSKEQRPQLIIGTQAILHSKTLLDNKKVRFVCIDEQHRFGVEQRSILKSGNRYVLTLSATPIPRTLALSFLGFSQAIFLDERPVNRKDIVTRVVPLGKEEATYLWMKKHLDLGEQAYVVFPRVESEEDSEKQSLLAMSEILKEKYFSGYKTATLFGSMKPDEKEKTMRDFSDGKYNILFATSVIEVGVDVGNATVIAIHGAELFGLAQLHQLRGRVGRSSQQGYCFLFSEFDDAASIERLDYFSAQNSGIKVAEYDLSHRGTGTLLGTFQSGLSELRIATFDDLHLVKESMDLFEELTAQKVVIPRQFRVKSTNE